MGKGIPMAYLTYDEYIELGGTLSEDNFPSLERKARNWLDSMTFGRISELPEVPAVVKEVMTEFITRISDYSNQSKDGETIASYSNGVETISYNRSTESDLRQNLQLIAMGWLPDYLVYRGINFDVRKYLQSNNNNL